MMLQKRTAVLFLAVTLQLLFCAVSVHAQSPGSFNDERMAQAITILMTFMEGSFGALIMTVAGLMAIFNAAMGNYKASMSLVVIALGTFILRSVIATFFSTDSIPGF